MATVTQIRDAIGVQMSDNFDGLSVYPRHVGTFNPPAAIVVPGEPFAAYGTGMGDRTDLNLVIAVLVATADAGMSEELLEPYIDPNTGVRARVGGSLGGLVAFCRVTTGRNYGVITYNGIKYLGADFLVRVTV